MSSSGDFDLLLWAVHTLPAGDPGFFLNGFFRTGAGNNYTGFSSPEVDRLLDRLAGIGTGRSPSHVVKANTAAPIPPMTHNFFME